MCRHTPNGFYFNKPEYSIHTFFNDYFFGQDKFDKIKRANIILLLGYSGQGKTSFCKKIIYDYINSIIPDKKDLFYFRLKDIRQVKNLVNDPLSVLYNEAIFLTETEINKHNFRKSILVLDGLDELFMKDDLRLDDINRFTRELIKESEKFKHLQIVITSRYGYVELDRIKNESILIFQLREFNLQLQLKWLDKYTRFHPEVWIDEIQLKEFHAKRKKSKNEYLLELLEQPLLLHIICSSESTVAKNANRTEIYNQLFNDLIERKYSPEGQIEILKNISKDDLRELIQEIAFAIYHTGNGFISRAELIKIPFIQKYLEKFPNRDFKQSIKGVMVSFYFVESEVQSNELNKEDNYVIEFLHKSLQEFMVAEKIVRSVLWEFKNKDLKGSYIIDNFHDSLKLLNYLFSLQPLTREIESYLQSLIEREDVKLKPDTGINLP